MSKSHAVIVEPSRELEVLGDYDVVVVGGGIAGVAAALASARGGAKTCLLEKFCALGGLATIGNVIIYLPLCDGRGHQVSAGICEELFRLSVNDEPSSRPSLRIGPVPSCWERGGDESERAKRRMEVGFNPVTYMYKLERLLLKHHVTILYDTRFAGVLKGGSAIEAVIIESKGGRQALTARAVVDASGDADVCQASGERTVSVGGNVRCGWYYYVDNGEVKLKCWSQPFSATKSFPQNGRTFRGDSARQVTGQVLESRHLQMQDLEKTRQANPGHDIFPIMTTTMPTHRMTRRLSGAITLRPTSVHRWYDDCVGIISDWRKAGPVYAVPFRALAAVRTGNLITAGRCISSLGDTWDVTRVIPACAVTGEAAGLAAAMLAIQRDGQETGATFAELDVRALQAALRRKGVLLDRHLVEDGAQA